jgi:sterol desaturase/sphingolipid hydroxylase (fatty acid hydroxylase superfamily)
MLPSVLIRSHLVTFCIYLAYSLIETTATHSGYDFFTFPLTALRHDLHHEKFVVNFGGTWVLDWIHGTEGTLKEDEKEEVVDEKVKVL